MASVSEEGKSTPRVILIGVGGATCSGKTTLAKHLKSCLPNSFIVHQDDFAPPQELVPFNEQYGVQDWDDAPGAIEWPRMARELAHVKQHGRLSDSHYSHDHLNEQKPVHIDEGVLNSWRKTFEGLVADAAQSSGNNKLIFAIVDGFLLYWDKNVYDPLDVRVFLRVPETVLKERRHQRHGYHTAVQSDPEGTLWRDPPHYWEQIVYPAYDRAHRELFVNGDIEHGVPTDKVKDLAVYDGMELSMQELFERSCQKVLDLFVSGT